ncbi:MAG: DEAD/DEAH box helicase, partial [Bacteroidota bacterium]
MDYRDYYTYLSNLDTDTFWVLAVMSLQSETYGWEVQEIVELLQKVGYAREDASPFAAFFVSDCLKRMKDEGLVKDSVKRKKTGLELHPLTARAVRQYLLANFAEDAYQMGMVFLSRYKGYSSRYPYWHYEVDLESAAIKVYNPKASFIKKLLAQMEPLDPEFEHDEYISIVSRHCGVESEKIELHAVSMLLPPYPENYLDEIPKLIRKEILKAFSRQPYLFRVDSHEQLWQCLEKDFAKDRELLANTAMHWLPNPPPGKDLDFFNGFPTLEKLSDWILGHTTPDEDTAEGLTGSAPSYALLLRARILMAEGLIDAAQLRSLMKPAKQVPAKLIEAVVSPAFFKGGTQYKPKDGPQLTEALVLCFGLYWAGEDLDSNTLVEELVYLLLHPHCAAMPWLKQQMARLLSQLVSEDDLLDSLRYLSANVAEAPSLNLLDEWVQPPSPWEELMAVLESQGGGGNGLPAEVQKNAKAGDTRMIFIYNALANSLMMREQTYGKKGWSSGRRMNWREANYSQWSEQDKVIMPALLNYHGGPIMAERLGGWQAVPYKVDVAQALYLLAGHPAVFEDDKKRIPLHIEQGKPQMLVEHNDQGDLEVSFEPDDLELGYNVRRAGPGKLICYYLDENNEAIAKRIPKGGITVPAFAADRLDQILPALKSRLDVQSSTEWMKEDLPQIKGDPNPCFHFVPLGDKSHRVEVYVKPLASLDLYFGPGVGTSKHLTATEEDGRMLLLRNLEGELQALEAAKSDCTKLAQQLDGHLETILKNDKLTLEVLREVKKQADQGKASIEYPKGQRLKLADTVDEDQLAVKISSGKDWFRVDAHLALDEHRVVDFELILEGMRNRDRFIKVGEDEYLSLTDKLRQRLEKMDALLQDNRGKKELSKLAATAFADAIEGLDHVELDDEWQDNLERMMQAQQYEAPPPPSDFKAVLRNYQLQGHDWLMRLANWGVGGCLADDMGLGKTVQALAVLCQRAATGPALVIAPASVIRNWRVECRRFAPSLNPKLIASANEAEDILTNLAPYDLVLLSFGLV